MCDLGMTVGGDVASVPREEAFFHRPARARTVRTCGRRLMASRMGGSMGRITGPVWIRYPSDCSGSTQDSKAAIARCRCPVQGHDLTDHVMGPCELFQEDVGRVLASQVSQRLQCLAMRGKGQGAELYTARFQQVGRLVQGQGILGLHRGSDVVGKRGGTLKIAASTCVRMSGCPGCWRA